MQRVRQGSREEARCPRIEGNPSYDGGVERVRVVLARRHGSAQVLLAIAAVELYELLRRLIQPDWPVAIRHARDVFALEQLAHLDVEGAVQRLALNATAWRMIVT